MNRIFWIIILILWILFGMWISRRFIWGNGFISANTSENVSKTTIIEKGNSYNSSWRIADGSAFTYTANEGLRFKEAKYDRLPTNESVNTGISNTAAYLKNSTNRSLKILGYYKQDEQNTSVFPNLGLARANNIKNWLVSLGASSSQIEMEGVLQPNAQWSNDTLYNGIEFAFDGVKENNSRIDEIKARLQGKPITLYFATNQDNINLTEQQRQDFADLNYYLDRVASAKLNITGHTDNIGNKEANTTLSEQRAEFAKNYLIQKGGINIDRMTVKGFGPTKPVATNDTAEGRAQNRRVEITLL